jgi:hypothetical protein
MMRYAQKQDKRSFFKNMTPVLIDPGLLEDHPGELSASGETTETGFQGKRLRNGKALA